jgi:AraC family transcriptional regulator
MAHPPHIGTTVREWRSGDFHFGCWATREFGPSVREHEHERAHVMFAWAGDYRSSVPGVDTARHRILFNPAGTVHADRFESPGLFFSINFATPPEQLWPDRVPERPALADSVRASIVVQRLIAEAGSADADGEHIVEALMVEMMSRFRPEPEVARRPGWLSRAVDALHEQTTAPSTSELARIAGVHPYHLAAVFRRFHGCTPAEYRRSLRASRSLDALLRTGASIAEIAFEQGFSDQSHLTRTVTAAFGIGPAELRRRLG